MALRPCSGDTTPPRDCWPTPRAIYLARRRGRPCSAGRVARCQCGRAAVQPCGEISMGASRKTLWCLRCSNGLSDPGHWAHSRRCVPVFSRPAHDPGHSVSCVSHDWDVCTFCQRSTEVSGRVCWRGVAVCSRIWVTWEMAITLLCSLRQPTVAQWQSAPSTNAMGSIKADHIHPHVGPVRQLMLVQQCCTAWLQG